MDFARGNFIDNQWLKPSGPASIRSVNPATREDVVLEAPVDPGHAALATAAAARAWPAWAALTPDERLAALRRFARELAPRTEALARAVTMEVGRTIREARQETQSLIERLDLLAEQQLPAVKPWSAAGVAGECRYHPLGVVAVIGPFESPLHTCHAHIVSALATGNTVVVKPSERAPLAFQRYMEAWAAAGLPPVLHMVQGGPEVGRALLAAKEVRGVALTGSWRTGHAVQRALVDRPEVLPALALGGQNMALVLEDADLDQALEGVLLGAFSSTGQRCTGTSRVLVQRSVAASFIDRLVKAAKRLTFGDPMGDVFMGPMASVGDRDRVEALCRAGREAGAEVLLPAEIRDGGAWRGPSIHLIAPDHESDYTREEVFGPDLAVTIVEDLDAAIQVLRSSPYGLSASVFSARRAAFEAVYLQAQVGCVNWNRPTNRTTGALPFGGVGRSGNFRPAGSDAVRYTTFPVQVQWTTPGALENEPFVRQAISAADPLLALEITHRIEEALEPYGLYPEVDQQGLAGLVRIPLAQLDGPVELSRALQSELRTRGVAAEVADGALRFPLGQGDKAAQRLARALSDACYAIRPLWPQRFLGRRPAGYRLPPSDRPLPRSQALSRRLRGEREATQAAPVIDLMRSSGAYLATVDDAPLVLLDASGELAHHATGVNAPAVLEAFANGRFGATPIDAGLDTAELARFAARLRDATRQQPHVRFCASGDEANELALATCVARRPGRRAVVTLRGASHGDTLLMRQLSASEGSSPFEIGGLEVRWLDLPAASVDAPEPAGWLQQWSRPAAERRFAPFDDAALAHESRVLGELDAALADDQVVAVFVQPVQVAGGLRQASARFLRATRVLTEARGVPLVLDEVETGLHRLGPTFAQSELGLTSPADVITCARTAQLGVTLSRWPIPMKAEGQAAAALRGLVHAEQLAHQTPEVVARDVAQRLDALVAAHPDTVLDPRQRGWAFAFDLPTREERDHLLAQGLARAYALAGVGERGLCATLHAGHGPRQIEGLFQRLDAAIEELETGHGELVEHVDLAPEWPRAADKLPPGYRLQRVTAAEWPQLRAAYEALHRLARPDSGLDFDHLSALLLEPDALCLAILHGVAQKPAPGKPAGTVPSALVAACLAVPLEHVADLDGPRQDATLGRSETLFSVDLTVHPEHRRQGLGRALVTAQIAAAMQQRRADGGPRFAFLTGLGHPAADDGARLAAEHGAWTVASHGPPEACVDYFRVALTWPRLPPAAVVHAAPATLPSPALDLDQGLERRLGPASGQGLGMDELREHYNEGRLTGAVVNRLDLGRLATPAVVRAHEWLRLQAPKGMPQLVLAASRSEALDKVLRPLSHHRRAARVVLALGPVRAGMATASARSVSLPEGDEQNWFGWPCLADPTRDPDRTLLELEKRLERQADKLLAVALEAVYTATGRAVPETFWGPLRELCDHHEVPLLLVESATGGLRSGRGLWRADTLPVAIDALVHSPGGQLGIGFVADRFGLPDALGRDLAMGGDELTLTRLVWELRSARRLPIAQRADELRRALAPVGEVHGEGLYLAVEHPQAEQLQRRILERQLKVGLTEDRSLRLCPALNVTPEEIQRLAQALREIAP